MKCTLKRFYCGLLCSVIHTPAVDPPSNAVRRPADRLARADAAPFLLALEHIGLYTVLPTIPMPVRIRSPNCQTRAEKSFSTCVDSPWDFAL
jgi:hypothetical protein